MIVGGYDLHLYCNAGEEWRAAHPGEWDARHEGGGKAAEFSGSNRAEAIRAARARGWAVNWKKGTAYCPACAAERKWHL